MDKELFKKTEGKLYRYYRAKKEIENLKLRIDGLEKHIKDIEHDIKATNVTIDYYQSGIALSERVQSSSSGESYAEKEIIREIEKLEREYLNRTRQLLKAKAKLRSLDEFIRHMDYNVGMLNEETKRFIELKYGDGANILTISRKLNIAQATAYRMREELVENICKYMNILT